MVYLSRKTRSKNFRIKKDSKEILRKLDENLTQSLKKGFDLLKNKKLNEEDFIDAIKLKKEEKLSLSNTYENVKFLNELTKTYEEKYYDYICKFGIKWNTSRALRVLIKEIENLFKEVNK